MIRALRELHPNVPALLVSGDTAPARLRDAHEAELTLLHKPVPVDLLTRTIREEVDRHKGASMADVAGPRDEVDETERRPRRS